MDTLNADPDELPVKPKRVLIFTTVTLLSLLSVCKSGYVDGTFKSQSRNWKQLFVVMVDYCDTAIPIMFCWLPDKKFISYYMVVFFLFFCFNKYRDEIRNLTGKDLIRLRKIKCDFEWNIHRAFSLFKVFKMFYFSTIDISSLDSRSL